MYVYLNSNLFSSETNTFPITLNRYNISNRLIAFLYPYLLDRKGSVHLVVRKTKLRDKFQKTIMIDCIGIILKDIFCALK